MKGFTGPLTTDMSPFGKMESHAESCLLLQAACVLAIIPLGVYLTFQVHYSSLL